MVGPIANQVPLVGPLKADAGLKEQEERRIVQEQSRQVKVPTDASSSTGVVADEILTAEGVINKLAKGVIGLSGRLSIDEDQDSGDIVYKVVDQKTGEILNQWPREELLRHARIARAQYEGLVVDEEV